MLALISRDEREGVAFFVRRQAAGAAHAVNVVVTVLRDVVVDDVRDAADVDPSADDVGGDQHADFATAERLHHFVAVRLRQVAVQDRDVRQLPSESCVQPVGSPFRAQEDQHLQRSLIEQQLGQRLHLPVFIDGQVILLDGFDGDAVRGAVYFLWRPHVAIGQPLDRFRQRGGEQHRLAVGRAATQDLFNVGTEADVEHPIRLIQDHDLELI